MSSYQVLAPYGLLYSDRKRITPTDSPYLDLRSHGPGAMLKIGVGRYATGTLSAGLDVIIRQHQTPPTGTARNYGRSFVQYLGAISYSNQLINYAAGYAAGVQSIAFDGQAASTAFAHNDSLCFWGLTTIPVASAALTTTGSGTEFLRCSAGTTTPLIPDSPTAYAHADNEYFTASDVYELFLPGGFAYSLMFDAGAVTTASAVFALTADITYR